MIFEYLPTNIEQDIERLYAICRLLPITKILIPSNPISNTYPDSLAIIATLRDEISKEEGLKHIQFIPTIKTSIYTKESLKSAFLTLKYLNILNVAIVSGDTLEQNTLTTQHALEILKDMREKNSFLKQLNIFCAIEATISTKNSYTLCKKLEYGVCNFITQPFYVTLKSEHITQKNFRKIPSFLSNKKYYSVEEFLQFYKHTIQIYKNNNLSLSTLPNNIKIYCGFLPLFHTSQANAINAKKLGITIPNLYIDNIKNNALHTNITLFNSLKYYRISISYLQFKDMQIFLNGIRK